jgi:hypothetical protein
MNATAAGLSLGFSAETSRPDVVRFRGALRDPLAYRDAMLCLRDVVIDDSTPLPKDRTQYFDWANRQIEQAAWLKFTEREAAIGELKGQMDQLIAKKNTIQSRIDEQNRFYWKHRSAFQRFIEKRARHLLWLFDPVISVHPDSVTFEAFSVDEASYGNIRVAMDQFNVKEEIHYGTTNIDFSRKLAMEMARVRSYHPLELRVNPGGLTVDLDIKPPYVEKKIDLPESWVKGFLQVSSAAALPANEIELQPIDMFNILTYFKRRRAHKSPRSLRFQLAPDSTIAIFVEPWEERIETDAVYKGEKPTEVRLWGRRRLLLLEKLLPWAKSFKIKLLGSGFPSFYVADLGNGITFTLGLSGWTAKDWSGGAAFSALAGFIGGEPHPPMQAHLKRERLSRLDALAKAVPDLDPKALRQSLGALYRKGLGFYDLAAGVVRYRELMSIPLPAHLTEPTQLEKDAAAMVATLEGLLVRVEEGEQVGKASVPPSPGKKMARHPTLRLGEGGNVVKAECDCREFKSQGLRGGPCVHLLALQVRMLESVSIGGWS